MYPGWGMSETSAGVVDCQFVDDPAADDDRFVPVGVPHAGVAVRIVDDGGRVVPEGTAGHLQASGTPITRGYANNPEQNRQSFTADGWFKTGDLAYLRDGVLTVTGRADDVIVLAGVAYHGHEIEAAVEELPFAEPSYTVASLVTGPDGAEELAVFLHVRDGAEVTDPLAEVRAAVGGRFGADVTHVVAVAREDVPKTGIGKLRRVQLRARFESGALGGIPEPVI
jgi:acyl-CoA synthetase (AMP-forming)/AMP-acid ligase II